MGGILFASQIQYWHILHTWICCEDAQAKVDIRCLNFMVLCQGNRKRHTAEAIWVMSEWRVTGVTSSTIKRTFPVLNPVIRAGHPLSICLVDKQSSIKLVCPVQHSSEEVRVRICYEFHPSQFPNFCDCLLVQVTVAVPQNVALSCTSTSKLH
jgi:hypothetical protein